MNSILLTLKIAGLLVAAIVTIWEKTKSEKLGKGVESPPNRRAWVWIALISLAVTAATEAVDSFVKGKEKREAELHETELKKQIEILIRDNERKSLPLFPLEVRFDFQAEMKDKLFSDFLGRVAKLVEMTKQTSPTIELFRYWAKDAKERTGGISPNPHEEQDVYDALAYHPRVDLKIFRGLEQTTIEALLKRKPNMQLDNLLRKGVHSYDPKPPGNRNTMDALNTPPDYADISVSASGFVSMGFAPYLIQGIGDNPSDGSITSSLDLRECILLIEVWASEKLENFTMERTYLSSPGNHSFDISGPDCRKKVEGTRSYYLYTFPKE